MMYLLAGFWLWLLLALVIGLVVGWITYRGRNPHMLRELWPWALVFVIGAAVVLLRVLPDRPGLWAELALMLVAGYFLGCLVSYWLRNALWIKAPDALAGAKAAAGTTVAAASTIALPTRREVAVEPAKEVAAKAEAVASEEAITGLSGPRNGKADDLTRVYGIDADIAARMNALGIYHYDQIAAMTPGQSRWLFNQLGHTGRFPNWWWRWKYDAGLLADGKSPGPESSLAKADPAESPGTGSTKKSAPAAGNLDAGAYEGAKPVGLAAARDEKPDDLKRIRGVGKVNEGRLHALGIWHFDQIAAWNTEESKWVGSYLAFSGRIESEDWRGQAATLAKGGVTEFAGRVDKGEVASSRDDTGDDGQSNIASLDKPVTKRPKA